MTLLALGFGQWACECEWDHVPPVVFTFVIIVIIVIGATA
jgi:hypothetical protein